MAATAGAIVGFLVEVNSKLILKACIAVPFVALSFVHPEWAILAVVAITASFVFHFAITSISIGSVELYLPDLILVFLVGLVLFKHLFDRRYEIRRTPINWLLLSFFAAGLMGAAIAVLNGSTLGEAMGELRYLSYYLLFFPILNLIRDHRTLDILLIALAVLAALIAIGQLLVTVYSPTAVYIGGFSQALYNGIWRVFPPGTYVVSTTLVCTFSVLLISRENRVIPLILLFTITAVGVGLSFSRMLWTVTMLCFGLIVVLASLRRKIQFANMLVLISVLVVTFGMEIRPVRQFGTALQERFTTLQHGEILTSDSMEYRVTEYRFAFTAIEKSPIVGHGLGYRYRPLVFGQDDNANYFIHNSYLWILKDMGVLGLIPFLSLFVTFLVRGFTKWRTLRRPLYRAVVLGTTLSMMSLMIYALQASLFMGNWAVSAFGLIMGTNEVIYALDRSTEASMPVLEDRH